MTDIFTISSHFVDDYAALMPIQATYAGVPGHDHRWGDLGPAGLDALTALLRRTLDEVLALPPGTDSRTRLAIRVLRERLADELEGIDHGDHLRDIAHINATVPALREALDVQDAARADGHEALLCRLEGLPDALAGWRERIGVALERDLLVARRQVESTIRQLHASYAADGVYPRRVEALAATDPQAGVRAAAALPAIVEACRITARFLEDDYLPVAPDRDAVGRERYLRSARQLLGTELDAEEVYAWGWAQLDGLLTRARAVAAQIDPTADLDQILDRLRVDAAYAATSPEDFRALMLARQRDALSWLADEHFDVPAEIQAIDVRLAPPGGALGASYVGPSEDFSRPGTIWWSFGHRQRIPLFDEVSTAYHEGFPGHHLQIGTQLTLADQLSRAHRMLVWRPGYGEGWALYTETLMDELGALERPEYELGYLTSALLRTVRVVVDIGLHLELAIPDDAPFHPGEPWSFALAVEALETLASLDHDYALSEVTRYLGWPAQAITYALGQRAILELREERRRREDGAFDLRRFHADVLGSGPLGLDHLREVVCP